jgi:hypothetical protein
MGILAAQLHRDIVSPHHTYNNVDPAFGSFHHVEVGCIDFVSEEHTVPIIRAEVRSVVQMVNLGHHTNMTPNAGPSYAHELTVISEKMSAQKGSKKFFMINIKQSCMDKISSPLGHMCEQWNTASER